MSSKPRFAVFTETADIDALIANAKVVKGAKRTTEEVFPSLKDLVAKRAAERASKGKMTDEQK